MCVFPACCCTTVWRTCDRPKWPWSTAAHRPTPATCCRSWTSHAWWSTPTPAACTDPRTVSASFSTWRTSTCPSLTSGAPVRWLLSYSRCLFLLIGRGLLIHNENISFEVLWLVYYDIAFSYCFQFYWKSFDQNIMRCCTNLHQNTFHTLYLSVCVVKWSKFLL